MMNAAASSPPVPTRAPSRSHGSGLTASPTSITSPPASRAAPHFFRIIPLTRFRPILNFRKTQPVVVASHPDLQDVVKAVNSAVSFVPSEARCICPPSMPVC